VCSISHDLILQKHGLTLANFHKTVVSRKYIHWPEVTFEQRSQSAADNLLRIRLVLILKKKQQVTNHENLFSN
jgi:hypothetical protein